MQPQTSIRKRVVVSKPSMLKKMWQQRYLYLFILPGLIWFVIFSYIPMAGNILAFKKFTIAGGIWNSPWVGLKNFKDFISSYYFPILMRNTIGISLIKLVFGFPVPIIFALLLNEIKNVTYKRVIQTVSYLPHFVSWVVALSVWGKLLSIDGGLINEIIIKLGGGPINFMAEPGFMWPFAYLSERWKETGWDAIIYLAALTSINPNLYEAAMIDGASKVQRIWYISLPGIKPTMVTLLILSAGGIFSSNFDQLFLLGTPPVINVTEVIDTYIYRQTLQNMQYGLGTAVGLMRAVINVILIYTVNKLANKYAEVGIF